MFTFIFSGFNFSLLATVFIYLGLVSYFNREGNSKFNYLYVFLSLWWLINSNGSYYFNVGKLRSFTSSIYEFNANLFWIIFIYFLLKGIYKFFNENKKNFNLDKFVKNLSYTSFLVLFFGIISANIPLMNFLIIIFSDFKGMELSQQTPLHLMNLV